MTDILKLLKQLGQAVSADDNEEFKRRTDEASADPKVRAVAMMLQHVTSMGDAELIDAPLVEIMLHDLALISQVNDISRDEIVKVWKVMTTIEQEVRAKRTAVLQAAEQQNAPSTETVQ